MTETTQPSPDLEPVWRLIEKQDHAYIHDATCIFWNRLEYFINDSFHEQLFLDLKTVISEVGYRETNRVAQSLLAEVTWLREENAKLKEAK